MATAPFQLWIDLATIASAVRTSGTVTVTTATPHGITTGAYIQMQGATDVAGTSMNGVYQATVASGTTFTYTSSGTAGTGVTGSACISYDLLNPLINYTGAAKEGALYIRPESMQFAISGDGSGASSSITVAQDDVGANGPWFQLIPDQARLRLVKKDTGTTPAEDGSDILFTTVVSNITARLNGSGQGVIADIAMQDVTSLLDRVFVYTLGKQRRFIEIGGAVRRTVGAQTTNFITTSVSHGLVNGGTASIEYVNGGGAGGNFQDQDVAISVVSSNQFSYAATGTATAGTGNVYIQPESITSSGTTFQITVPVNSNFDSGPTVVRGVTATDAISQNLINTIFSDSSIGGTANNIINVFAPRAIPSATYDVSSAEVRGLSMVTPAGTLGDYSISIAEGETEQALVTSMLTAVDNFKSFDPAFQRLLSTTGTAKITGSTELTNPETYEVTSGGLRSVLESIAETFQGIDGIPRRYFVDVTGKLNYAIVDDSAKPTYATAPYKLISSGTANPNTTTEAATLIPYGLQIGYDNLTTKSGISLTNAGTVYSPIVSTYRDYEYPARLGAPYFDGIFDEPAVSTMYRANSYRAANSFFSQAHPTLLSGFVTFRGAGTAAHNQYGFNAGYAQTGASTFALVNSWQPGQWVDITCAELGLTGLYRIEQVDWTLEPGSFTQIITITFSHKPQYGLSTQLAQVR
jgi:hypothetical protein